MMAVQGLLADPAMNFYQTATRTPSFSYKYTDGENEYICDFVLSDIVGLWVTKLTGMTKEEMEIVRNNPNLQKSTNQKILILPPDLTTVILELKSS